MESEIIKTDKDHCPVCGHVWNFETHDFGVPHPICYNPSLPGKSWYALYPESAKQKYFKPEMCETKESNFKSNTLVSYIKHTLTNIFKF
jgi:hypothetical protein